MLHWHCQPKDGYRDAPACLSSLGRIDGAAPCCGPAEASPQPTPLRLQVQSAAELSHLVKCHPHRLLVVHFSIAGCDIDTVRARRAAAEQDGSSRSAPLAGCRCRLPRRPDSCCCPHPLLSQAFQPLLREACRRHPDALFLHVALQPHEVAAAAGASSLATAAAAPLPGPSTASDRAELLHSLSIGQLPCTLLLRGGELLARLEAGTEGGAPTLAQGAAAAAALELHAAVLAAGVQARLQHADCARGVGGVALASWQ